MFRLNASRCIGSVRLQAAYSQAAKTGKSAPARQQFRKRIKDAVAIARPGGAASPQNQREALTEALFSVSNENVPPRDARTELEQRREIATAWSRVAMAQLQEQTAWERGLLRSKMQALDELQAVCPELAQHACQIDYSIPPAHRRIPTDTPPDPTKFPYRMSSLDGAEDDAP